MRKVRVLGLCVALVSLSVGLAAPAGAAPAEKSTVITAGCPTIEFTQFAPVGGDVVQARGTLSGPVFRYDAGSWLEIGREFIDLRVTMPDGLDGAWVMQGRYTFTSTSSFLADTTGRFVWTRNGTRHGVARADDGTLVKSDIALDPTPYWPLPACSLTTAPFVNEWTVIRP